MELETQQKILYKTNGGGGRKDYKIDCIVESSRIGKYHGKISKTNGY